MLLQPQQALLRPLVAGRRGAHLGVVQRQGGEEDARAVEVEVAAVNPELAEAEPHRAGRRPGPCRRPPTARRPTSYVFCGVWMSQSFSGFHFSVTARRPSLRSPAWNGLLVNSLTLRPLSVIDGAKRVPGVGSQVRQRRAQRDLALAHRGVHLHVVDARARGRADEVNVAAQAAPLHLASAPLGRVGVVEHEHDCLGAAWRRRAC